jgi:hypothetical protein
MELNKYEKTQRENPKYVPREYNGAIIGWTTDTLKSNIVDNIVNILEKEFKFKNGTELNLCKTFNQLHKRLIGQYVIAKSFLKTIKKHDKITYAIYTKSILNKKKILLNTITIIDTPTYVKTLLFGYIPLFKRYKR